MVIKLNFLTSFIITILSGMSTLIGCLILLNKSINYKKVLSNSLLFSSGVMLFISVFDLIPSSFLYINKIYDFIPSMAIIGVYVLFGGILVYTLDSKYKNNNKIYKIGIISMLTLIIHNIPEGIITFVSSSKDLSVGIPIAFSIALHNIPEGIAISVPLYYGDKNIKKAFLYTLCSALSEPFGAIIGYLFFYKIDYYFFGVILSFTSGIMIYLSIFELFIEGIKYKEKNFFYFLLGMIIILLSILLI